MRCKLYRMRDEQWKERGTGNCKLMRHKENKKVRFVMRQEKTLKPVANFISKNSIAVEAGNSNLNFTYSARITIVRFDPHEEQRQGLHLVMQ